MSGSSARGSVIERIRAKAIESRENDSARPSNGGSKAQCAANSMPSYPGLERWRLIEKIGDGAFSTVYRASDTQSEYNEVAVKVMKKYEMNETQKQKLVKEVEIARKLKHENVVHLIDASETRQFSYMIIELCPGGELYDQITQLTSLDENLSRHVIKQVGKAVEYLHETMGIVHRDIKPENILFYPRVGNENDDEGNIGVVKLADFGEQKYTTGVDMWALGCLLYTMLGGFPPFFDEDFQAMARKVLRGEYEFASPNWDPISEEAKDLINGLLAVHPEERLNIKEFLAHPWIRQNSDSKPASHASTPAIDTHDFGSQMSAGAQTPPDLFQEAIESAPGTPNAHTPNIRDIFNVALSVQQSEPRRGPRHMSQGPRPDMKPTRPKPITRFSDMTMDNCTPSALARSRPQAVNRAKRMPSANETTAGERFNKTVSTLSNLNLNNSALLEKRRARGCGGTSTPTHY
ncbi:isocitrate lyase [Penicillium atrosanguineum]|uniref:isocitrate lyase n=1 Tax=Penicillium atrosanguineum TaxID=1132637 RepID=UPI00239DEDEE|nr:isocitrate lyase [Penicillium atrosanguineum]KAJ5296971.1 isocitrate lyase [Penicillium atrosanguineum]